jgi:hypothetical protein
VSTRQLPVTQWLPAPPLYGEPWHAHVWPVEHALSSAHVSDVHVQNTTPPPLSMQRPFTPASTHCESLEHMPGPPLPLKLHVPLGAGPRHSPSFGRWFTGGTPPLEEPLPELLLDAPLEDPLPELLLDPPEPLLDAPLDDPLPLLDAPLEEPLPPEPPPEPLLELVPSSPASPPPANVVPPHAQRAAAATSPHNALRMTPTPLLLSVLLLRRP